jgi:hypothetical protein
VSSHASHSNLTLKAEAWIWTDYLRTINNFLKRKITQLILFGRTNQITNGKKKINLQERIILMLHITYIKICHFD